MFDQLSKSLYIFFTQFIVSSIFMSVTLRTAIDLYKFQLHELGDVQSFYYQNKAMKEKFSIFSSTSSKTDPLQTSIAFKKSPNKFAVYENNNKTKELPKYGGYQSLSTTNLDHLKRLPNEYSNLRQTLTYKTSDFDIWAHQQDKDKSSKSPNILRQTLNTKPSYKQRSEKFFSQSFAGHEFQSQSTHELFPKNDQYGTLGYSKVANSNLTESKSLHTFYDPKYQAKKLTQCKKTDQKIQDWKNSSGKWRQEQAYKKVNESNKQSKLAEQIQILEKIAKNKDDEKPKEQPKDNKLGKVHLDRKFSQSAALHSYSSELQESVFRKKVREKQDSYQQCYTPKLPKYTYQERFKKVGSPTSTDNSDSRSPPNKFVEVPDLKKKNPKMMLQDFSVGKNLGEGKFGLVMVARHKKNGFLIALKKIPKAMIKSHYMVEQLTLQIRLQSCINHKNILIMYGFFDDATHFYIVLQYMQQGTLYSQLKKNRILSEKDSAIIIKQMAEAVEYLHDQDIAHRDIKPENIVISNNVYKLCDFGWATLCNQRRKTYCGTFDYAAPEILQGKQYDMSVDLWCLGVLTYELLTGKAPFYHLSRKETMKKILNVQTQSITYPENMSAQAIDFIDKLIRKDPNERMKASDALKHPFLKGVEQK